MTDSPVLPPSERDVTGGTGVVSLEGITKSYGGTQVVKDVSLAFRPGTVHGLVGENGAGKSTLMKVLCGVEHADAGRIVIDGSSVTFRSPGEALDAGISLISQELAVVPALSVLQNVFLGNCSQRLGWRAPAADRERFRQLCATTGFELDPHANVGSLPQAQQQKVEVLRAVSRDARLIVMDEPTAVLSEREATELRQLMRKLADLGTAVVLISHFLEEVLDTCDDVTVLRDGEHVLSAPAAEHTSQSLVGAMVGESVDVLFPERPTVEPDAPVVLEASGLRRGVSVRGVDITVRRGEIVGLAGLVGSGRSETARLIFGADRAEAGAVAVNGRPVRLGSARSAMRAGIAMVPESRKDQGLLLGRSMRENIALANTGNRSSAGVVHRRSVGELTSTTVRNLDIRPPDPGRPVWTLSGGNQQKVLLGRWVAREPRVLIVDEPTRGVDIAAKAAIHRQIVQLARAGMAVLMISSEVEEVLGLCHRVLVMRGGRLVASLDAETADAHAVISAAFAEPEEPA